MNTPDTDIVIFTDGSSRGNPGPGGWGSVLVWVNDNQVTELSGYSAHTTNNIMELTALYEALRHIIATGHQKKTIHIYSDSEYVVAGITKWAPGWIKRGWKTSTGGAVANQELWSDLYSVWKQVSATISRVYGHASVPGNERCDVLATMRADRMSVVQYNGSLTHYPIQTILHIPTATDQSAQRVHKKSTTTKSVGAWYVSYVDGVVERHSTWDECKARVHGRSAKYKKIATQSEELQVLRDWRAV